MSDEFILKLTELTQRYGEKEVFKNASLQLAYGEKLGLFSENGTGKTTLFRALTGLTQPQTMQLMFDGVPVCGKNDFVRLRQKMGYVLQNPEDQLVFPEVLEDVMFGPTNLGRNPRECYDVSCSILESLGILHLRHSLCETLSGGQKRLVSLAGVLAMSPTVLLLDEPTNDLDEKGKALLVQVLKNASSSQIIVSHDKEFLKSLCTRFVTIQNKAIVPINL